MLGKITRVISQMRALMSLPVARTIALQGEMVRVSRELDALRSKLDLDPDLIARFQTDRKTDEYRRAFIEDTPLVSVCVGTYNRADLLVGRCLPSILGQEYQNIEVIVVGDGCTDDTGVRISALDDPRVRFTNLAGRGQYPEDSDRRWMVAGTAPVNSALGMATGTFVTHLDDDDEYTPDRIGKLVGFIQQTGADLVWHPFRWEGGDDQWRMNNAEKFAVGSVTTSSIFYHNWLRNIHWDPNAFEYYEPGDWNRLRKIWHMGAMVARYPECLLMHYKERTQSA